MKLPSRTIGLFQAAGLVFYVSSFALTVNQVQQWLASKGIQPQPVVGITFFLLAFIISAIICASIVFAYPAFLFFENKKNEAVKIILWSLTWLIFFFIAFLAVYAVTFGYIG